MYNWKLDNIDLDAYGVRVARSRGLLDLSVMVSDGYDWLDEHGKDYWQKPENVKYGDREIILDCYISARADQDGEISGFDAFKAKLALFYTAITAPGQKILTTPYGEIPYVSLQKSIEIPKRSAFIKSAQVGLFSLRLTVHGEGNYSWLTIAHKSGGYAAAVVKHNNLTVHRRLQGECYATCTTEVNEKLSIDRFDKIFLNFRGPSADTFYLDKAPEVRKLSTNKYVYNLRFEHESLQIKNVAFLLNGEADFYWFANLDEIIDKIVENTGRVFSANLYQKGSVVSTVRRNHKFAGENCLQVLQRIAAEYELEWGYEEQTLNGFYYINVAPRIEREWPFTLEYGKGKGLYEITRDAINTEELYTAVYAFGSNKNLKPSYGKMRLECPGNPITANTNIFGTIEHVKIFEDVFPNRTGAVSGYNQVLKVPIGHPQYTAYDAIKEVWPGGLFRLEDNTLDFDINQYLLGGLTAKIRMKTGDLAGFEFEIEKYDHAIRSIYLIRFKDERGELFPNENLTINPQDTYTLIDIGQPEDYVEDAESALLAAALDYLDEHSVPKVTYRVVVDPAFMQNNFEALPQYQGFDVGDKIAIIDSDLGLNAQYRISELSKNFHTARYEIRLSESRILTQREVINHRLNAIEKSLQDTKKDEVEQMRKDKETTTELRGRIFDPEDDLQDLDRTVRKESIDPRMLAYDAGVPQFSIRNALAEANYQGEYDLVKIGSGHLIIHNYPANTANRYDIRKFKDNDLEYNPTREWIIPETIIHLESESGYWIYAKIPLDESENYLELFVEQDHVEVKNEIDDGFICYKLGHISDQSSPRTVAMLWGNVKQSAAGAVEIPIINQPGHGFIVGDVIRHNGTMYIKAQANNDVNAQACGIVSEIIDGDNFKFIADGFIQGAWTNGAEYFLSPTTPGQLITLTDPETWNVGEVRLSCGWGTTLGLKVEIDVGDVISEYLMPTTELKGVIDLGGFEWCVNPGLVEEFKIDIWAPYEYTILYLILETDAGTLQDVSVYINETTISGIDEIEIGEIAKYTATGEIGRAHV